MREHKTRRRRGLMLVILAGLSVMAALIWHFGWSELSTTNAPLPTNRGILADGSTIGLVGLSTKSPHEYFNPDEEELYARLVAGLPRKIRESVFGFFPKSLDRNSEIDPDQDYLGVWLERDGTTPLPGIPQLRISDSEGNYATMPWTQAIWWSHRGNQLHGLRVVHFPRRARTLTLELETPSIGGRWTPFARWEIANPKRRTDRPTRRPIATRQSFAGYELRLARATMTLGTNRYGVTGTGTVMEFNLTSDAKPSTDWRIERISMKDADGNQLIQTETSFSHNGGTITATTWGDYHTREFPLSMKVRVAPGPHAPGDLVSRFQQTWTVTNNLLKGTADTNYPDRLDVFGHQLELGGYQSLSPGLPSLSVESKDPMDLLSISLLSIIDDHGNSMAGSQQPGVFRRELRFPLLRNTNSTSFIATFQIESSLELDFVIDPTLDETPPETK